MTPFRFLIRFAIFLLVFLVVAEGWLRYVTPASEQPAYRQDRQTLVYNADPSVARSGLATEGRIPHRLSRWHVNDAGWLSPFRYAKRQPGSALVALFGDSYVQGLSVPQDQHLDVVLHGDLGARVPVYAFGLSGWYLEQYVAMARFVRDTYDPSVIVILIAQGDVSQSLSSSGEFAYWYHISRSGSAYREVPPSQVYVLSRKARLARKSALVRYLRYNAQVQLPFVHGNDVQGAPTSATADAGTRTTASGPALAQAEQPLVDAALPAVRFMVGTLQADHPGVPIVFAARGDRYLPLDAVATSPLAPEMEALREVCAGRPQCHFLDLRRAFSLDWAQHHQRFEAADGAHYNARADAVAARAIADYIRASGLLNVTGRP
jgi:hypothetical protein